MVVSSPSPFEQGLARAAQGDLLGAIAAWERAIAADPSFVPAWFNAGLAHYKLGRYDLAVACLEQASRLEPGNLATLLNLGAARKRTEDVAGAIACYRQILDSNPGAIDARHNLANALEKLGELQEAESHLRGVVAAQPQNPNVWHSLGNILWEQNRLEDALVALGRALALEPNHAEARANRGAIWLTLGRLREGWLEYEWRWRCVEIARGLPRSLNGQDPRSIPLWLGEAEPSPEYLAAFAQSDDPEWKRSQVPQVQPGWGSLAGKRILLYGDMGLGDAIQFVRYVPLLAAQGARVVVQVEASLVRLLSTVAGVEQVVAGAGFLAAEAGNAVHRDRPSPLPNLPAPNLPPPNLPPSNLPPPNLPLSNSPSGQTLNLRLDFWSPLMSLPAACGTTAVTLPTQVPYLQPPPERPLPPRSPTTRARIGLVWSSGRVSATRRQRSCSLELFLSHLVDRLASGEIEWVVLQKELTSQESHVISEKNITNCGPLLRDFADTAAIIADLDLVIAVDTAVVHVAGAIARPVWVLLPWLADWRWGRRSPPTGPETGPETNLWYPTARLWRQPALGDWASLLNQVAQALGDLLSSPRHLDPHWPCFL